MHNHHPRIQDAKEINKENKPPKQYQNASWCINAHNNLLKRIDATTVPYSRDVRSYFWIGVSLHWFCAGGRTAWGSSQSIGSSRRINERISNVNEYPWVKSKGLERELGGVGDLGPLFGRALVGLRIKSIDRPADCPQWEDDLRKNDVSFPKPWDWKGYTNIIDADRLGLAILGIMNTAFENLQTNRWLVAFHQD